MSRCTVGVLRTNKESAPKGAGSGELAAPVLVPHLAAPSDWEATHKALFWPRADEAYLFLDAEIRAVQILSGDLDDAPDKAHVDHCVAHLDGVRDALYDLHFGAFEAKTRRSDCKGFPLCAYLVAGHLWCRAVLEGLRRYISPPPTSTMAPTGALAVHGSAYVLTHIELLFRELVVLHETAPHADYSLRPILQRAEHVHAEIAGLSRGPRP